MSQVILENPNNKKRRACLVSHSDATRTRTHWPLVFSASFTVLLLALTYTAFVSPALDRTTVKEQKSYEPYYFLYNYTKHYDVILANPGSSKSNPIPTFSGKLVGLYNDLPFIPDLSERVSDAAHFFDVDARRAGYLSWFLNDPLIISAVKVEVVKAHPKYKKVVRRSVKFHAHDERSEAKVGDVVRIVETRPISKTKHWRLAEVVEAAK